MYIRKLLAKYLILTLIPIKARAPVSIYIARQKYISLKKMKTPEI